MRFDQIKHQPSQPDQRERPDTAGDRWFVALVGFLEGEAEKKGQCEQQRQPLGEFDGRHGPVYHADPSARADLFEIREMDSLAEGMGFESRSSVAKGSVPLAEWEPSPRDKRQSR